MRRAGTCVAIGLLVVTSFAASVAGAQPPAQHAQPSPGDKSFAVYIGKNLTENGHAFLGGFGHEPSSHWMDIVPHQRHPPDATVQVGATDEADIPGELATIPQANETARYITSNYSEFAGFPAPLTNGGLNEYGVAARDVWLDSRPELVNQTPTPQRGPQYSDLSRIAMERAHSAREAVEILGDLINRYGYTTYGGNSHLFADAHEGWVFIEMAGGQGLWAAQRLGPDEVRVSYPGYIEDFPTTPDADHLSSPNLISYAARRGWWPPGEPFNVHNVYGAPFPGQPVPVGGQADPNDPAPYRHPPSLEAEFRRLAPVKLQDVQRIVRDPRWSDDRSGYGQVAELDDSLPDPGLATLWVAVTAAVTAPYIPVHIGTQSIPPEYRQHRYLTHNSSNEYLDPEFTEQEATESATQTYKRLLYATCARPDTYLRAVTQAFEGFEAAEIDDVDDVQQEAADRYAAGDHTGAQRALTEATAKWAGDGLALGNHLLEDQLARSKNDGGIHQPDVPVPDGASANARSQDMSLRGVTARDRVNCDLGGSWAQGGTLARKGHYGDPADVPDFRATNGEPAATPWPQVGFLALGALIAGVGAVAVTSRRERQARRASTGGRSAAGPNSTSRRRRGDRS